MTTAKLHSGVLAQGDSLGCYRVDNFLGQGGFGVTYLARDTMLDIPVAIKEYLPESIAVRRHDGSVGPKSSADAEIFRWGMSRFIQEAQTLARFKHPNIVRVMTVFEQNGTAYMVMEYERGLDLKTVFNRPGNNSQANLKRIFAPILDGLEEVHSHGYIHRDIKPANILIRSDGSPVLLDFGSARQATGAHTRTLTALVSVGFAPLEQYNGADDQQGPWTDVYALGAVLYHAITRNTPLESTLRVSAVLNDRVDPLKALRLIKPDGYSRQFCDAIDWALRFKVADRPQSIAEWRRALLNDTAPARVETRAGDAKEARADSGPGNMPSGPARSRRAEVLERAAPIDDISGRLGRTPHQTHAANTRRAARVVGDVAESRPNSRHPERLSRAKVSKAPSKKTTGKSPGKTSASPKGSKGYRYAVIAIAIGLLTGAGFVLQNSLSQRRAVQAEAAQQLAQQEQQRLRHEEQRLQQEQRLGYELRLAEEQRKMAEQRQKAEEIKKAAETQEKARLQRLTREAATRKAERRRQQIALAAERERLAEQTLAEQQERAELERLTEQRRLADQKLAALDTQNLASARWSRC